jgi:hypothetical protein
MPKYAHNLGYTLDDCLNILRAIPEPARTCFALACFAGLREGEIRGFDWVDWCHDEPDWPNGVLHLSQPPNMVGSFDVVPVIEQLALLLEMRRLRGGNPTSRPMLLSEGAVAVRLCLDSMARRVIIPILNRCKHCGGLPGNEHLKSDHAYERDNSLPEWRGWHAARRGLALNLAALGVPDQVIQRILRRSSSSRVRESLFRPLSPDVTQAMDLLSRELNKKSDSLGLAGSNGRNGYLRELTPNQRREVIAQLAVIQRRAVQKLSDAIKQKFTASVSLMKIRELERLSAALEAELRALVAQEDEQNG